jgi:hypothetical protein
MNTLRTIIEVILVLLSILFIFGYLAEVYDSKSNTYDFQKGKKSFIVVAIILFVFSRWVAPAELKQTYENVIMGYKVHMEIDEEKKHGTVSLSSEKAYPGAAAFCEDAVREMRSFYNDFTEVEDINIKIGNCSNLYLSKQKVQVLLEAAKSDQYGLIGIDLGLYSYISSCVF